MHKEDKTLKAMAAVYDKYNVTSEEEVFVSTWGADEKACRADIVKKFPPARAAELIKASEELKTIISNHIQEMIDDIADVISKAELKKKADETNRLPVRYTPEHMALLSITNEPFKQHFDERYCGNLSITKGKNQFTLSNLDTEILLSRTMGTSTKKLYFYILHLVTLSHESDREVYLNLKEYAKINDQDISTDSKRKAFMAQIRRDLSILKSLNVKPIDGSGQTSFVGAWRELNAAGEYPIEFLESTWIELKKKGTPFILIPTCLYPLPNKDPNAFSIGLKLVDNYDNLNNRARNKHNILSVKSLLEFAPCIQSIAEYRETGRGHFKTELKKQLEKALDENVKAGYLQNWSYKQPGTKGKKVNKDSVSSLEEFESLMIEYTPKIIDINFKENVKK